MIDKEWFISAAKALAEAYWDEAEHIDALPELEAESLLKDFSLYLSVVVTDHCLYEEIVKAPEA